MESQKYKVYDGTSDVRKFVTRVELEASLKNHAGEKKAQYIASKLVGHAMDVYLRMAGDDQKDPEIVKGELLKEFERGQLNREEAITELDDRKRLAGESAETFAHKIIELVKLAYPSFADGVRRSLAKDYFVRGLSAELRLAVKSVQGFSDMDIKAVAEEAVRLELAGVGVPKSSTASAVNSCDDMVDVIASKVIERLGGAGLATEQDEVDVNNVGYRYDNFRGRSSGRGRGRGRNRGSASQSRPTKKCRSCQETGHLIRNCPKRYCQACGGQGHDQYNTICPNYEP